MLKTYMIAVAFMATSMGFVAWGMAGYPTPWTIGAFAFTTTCNVAVAILLNRRLDFEYRLDELNVRRYAEKLDA